MKRKIVYLTLTICLLAACSSKTRVESDLYIKGAPDWVNEGAHIVKDKGGRLFHGVGSAPAMGDDSLQMATADNRARAEVARALSSYLDIISRDYSKATVGSRGSSEDDEGSQSSESRQDVMRRIENVTSVNLSGAKIIGRWRNRKTNVIYSIAELDMKQVKETLQKTRELNEGLRDYIGTNADSIFDRSTGEVR